ncbi:hypothetical protein D3C87_2087390 [compost metagenome]
MRKPGQHGMLEFIQLVFKLSINAGIGVTKQIDPPRTDRIQIALAIRSVQPGPLTVADWN